MKAAQVSQAGGDFEIVKRPIPQPTRGQVRIKVEACGICHSDAVVKGGYLPGIEFPRVPGHEIAGRIDSVAEDVSQWRRGSASAWAGMEGTLAECSEATSHT
jgi:propanol-preferring alcohol dehydrogenase